MNDNRKIIGIVLALLVLVGLVFGLIQLLGDDDSTSDDAADAGLVADDQSDTDDSTADDGTDDDVAADDGAADDGTDDDDTAGVTEGGDDPGDADTPGQVVIGQDEDGNDIVMEIEITNACAITFHTPIDDDSFSHIVWKYNAPGLEDGTEVTIDYSDGSTDVAVVRDKVVSVEQGITSYGNYPFPEITWQEDADTTSTITPDGQHVVDDKEGLPSETCLQ